MTHHSHTPLLPPYLPPVLVVEMLRDSGCLLSEEGYTHRCPFDWRTKGAVIVRTTMQWFAAVGGIKAEVCQRGTLYLSCPSFWCHICLSFSLYRSLSPPSSPPPLLPSSPPFTPSFPSSPLPFLLLPPVGIARGSDAPQSILQPVSSHVGRSARLVHLTPATLGSSHSRFLSQAVWRPLH